MKAFHARAVSFSVGALLLLAVLLLVSQRTSRVPTPVSDMQETASTGGDLPDFSGADNFESFSKWLGTFRSAGETPSAALMEVGTELARLRAVEMKDLIRMDPEEALARSMPLEDRDGLPDEMLPLIEKPFSTRAEMDVFPLCTDSDGHGDDPAFGERDISPGARRQGFEIEMTTSRGDRLEAFVFGERLNGLSRRSAPVQGIRLEGIAALREEVFTVVPESDLEETRKRYTVGPMGVGLDFFTAEPVGAGGVAAIAAGQLHFFASLGNLGRANDLAARVNRNVGEENGAQLLFTERLTISHAPLDPNEVLEASEELEAIASDTTRTAICILVDFSDKTGIPIDSATLQTRMDGEVHDQVASMSYHKTGISTPLITQTFRMPQPTTYYNGTDDGQKKNGDLFNHAIAAAEAAGISTSGYNHRCVFFKGIGTGYCGLATVGGSKVWLPCHGSKVIVHELGHNFGLGHASFWTATNGDPTDPAGSTSEYGDNTDIMGGGGVTAGHFHVQGKRKLNWLESDQVHYVGGGSSEQSLRIYRFDHEDTDLANWKRAVRVERASNEYFWLGYRQRYGSYPNYQKGVQLHWQQAGKSKSWLMDLTPADTKNNSGLPLGKTYSDPVSDVHITALKRGGSTPNQWIDVQVNVGPFSGNTAPTGTVNIPSRVPVNAAIELGASATDAEGDDLAYFFDIGDGSVLGNDGTLSWRSHSWSSTGSETLLVTVSDQKGGLLQSTVQVAVQSAIPAPTGIVATDGEYSDKVVVSWSASASATGYTIYRGTEDAAHASGAVGTVAGVTTWEDTDAFPGERYFYRVQALGSNSASELSVSDAGESTEGPPEAPVLQSISDNLFTDRIQLNWFPVDHASGYEILRGTTDVLTEATPLASVTGVTGYSDTAAEAGIRFFYWIRSTNALGSSGEVSGSGSRRLPAPANFSSSDGTFVDRVELSWDPVPNATGYRIFRGSSSGASPVQIGETSDSIFSDTPSTVLTTYWYSVRAYSDGSGEGEASVADSGFRVFQSPDALTTVQRAYDDRVELGWNGVGEGSAETIKYIVYRGLAGSAFSEAVEIARTTDLNFKDYTAEPGVEYSYWIIGTLEGSDVVSPPGNPIAGVRSEVPPFQPDATIGPSPAAGLGDNVINASGAGQFFSQKTKKSKPVSWYIRVENDGIFEDDLRVIGSGGDRYFHASLQEMFGARRNVTAASVAGAYRVDSVEPDGSRLFVFTATPTKKARKKGRMAFFDLRSVSASDVSHMDRVLMQVIAKKDKKRRRRR